ncbi:MAG: patatin-like phospholipase family protein [Pseudomonadales bacterium]|nr:patatin-like phospholipase family protein [Pseudomonadales bacterium]
MSVVDGGIHRTSQQLGVVILYQKQNFNLDLVTTLIFSGGGNRCWWQAGFVDELINQGWALPKDIIGCSAGAAVAASLISESTEKALKACKRLYADNPSLIRYQKGGLGLPVGFAQQKIYPNWLKSFLGEAEFAKIRSFGRFRVTASRLDTPSLKLLAITRAIFRHLRGKNFIVAGQREYAQKIAGLSQVFLEPTLFRSLHDALTALEATAAASPFIFGRKIAGKLHFDGGYISPIPVTAKELIDSNVTSDIDESSSTLTLLTRHFETKPMLFSHYGKRFIQPSRKIPVSTWGCTADTTVDDAFDLGQTDARHFIEKNR